MLDIVSESRQDVRYALHGAKGMDVNNRLRVLRAERRWSQAELALRLDVSRQAVNAIETGKHDPSLPLAFRIARLFESRIEDIFDDGEAHAEGS
jgi:putative transcriptional regulator